MSPTLPNVTGGRGEGKGLLVEKPWLRERVRLTYQQSVLVAASEESSCALGHRRQEGLLGHWT